MGHLHCIIKTAEGPPGHPQYGVLELSDARPVYRDPFDRRHCFPSSTFTTRTVRPIGSLTFSRVVLLYCSRWYFVHRTFDGPSELTLSARTPTIVSIPFRRQLKVCKAQDPLVCECSSFGKRWNNQPMTGHLPSFRIGFPSNTSSFLWCLVEGDHRRSP